MALNKRQYTDGQTIITASNLNEIQDCIIALEQNYVPKTRTVAGKALSSNITLAASDVGAVPVARTVNGKALSSNITLASSDISDDSGAGGTNVKASLVALKGSLDAQQGQITAYVETGTTASRAYGKGQLIAVNGRLYLVLQPIASGAAFTVGTNIEATTLGNELTQFVLIESTLTFNNGSSFIYDGHIKANSKLLAGLSYITPGSTSGEPRLYFVTAQPNIDRRAVIYIRNADGTIPPTIELTVYLIISNQV